jgi:hypothetical protein
LGFSLKYIIYHQVKKGVDCPDGIMAAAIAQLANPDAELIGDWYNSDGPDFGTRYLERDDELFIVDFSYPSERLLLWDSWGVEITLIDHHAPKFPELEGFSGAILDANECGATLTWKYFFPGKPVPEILRHVRRRDIGADGYYKAAENCLDSKQITAALSKGRSTSADKIAYLQNWLTASAEDIEGLRKHGEELQAADAERAAELAAIAYPSELPAPCDDIACWKLIIQNEKDNRLVSQIGAAICQENGEGTIAWIVASTGENSLRSHGVNISGYAKALGGGGHEFAAGFPAQAIAHEP